MDSVLLLICRRWAVAAVADAPCVSTSTQGGVLVGPDSRGESGSGGDAAQAGRAEAIRVGGVSQIGRGRHTTRNVTLLPVRFAPF